MGESASVLAATSLSLMNCLQTYFQGNWFVSNFLKIASYFTTFFLIVTLSVSNVLSHC